MLTVGIKGGLGGEVGAIRRTPVCRELPAVHVGGAGWELACSQATKGASLSRFGWCKRGGRLALGATGEQDWLPLWRAWERRGTWEGRVPWCEEG